MKKGLLGNIIIPECIVNRWDIPDSVKLFYGFVVQLRDWARFKKGFNYCYASNYFFGQKFAKAKENDDGTIAKIPLPVRTLSSWINVLRTKGFIRTEIAVYNGKTQRRIYLSEAYKNLLPREIEEDEPMKEDEFDDCDAEEDMQKTATPPAESDNFLVQEWQKSAEGSAKKSHDSNKNQKTLKKSNVLFTNPQTPYKGANNENRHKKPKEHSSAAGKPATASNSEKKERRQREQLKTPDELLAEGRVPQGKFKNIWLTLDELKQLKNEFPDCGGEFVDDVIEQLSAYVTHKPRYCLNNYFGVVTDWCLKKKPKKVNIFYPGATDDNGNPMSEIIKSQVASLREEIQQSLDPPITDQEINLINKGFVNIHNPGKPDYNPRLAKKYDEWVLQDLYEDGILIK